MFGIKRLKDENHRLTNALNLARHEIDLTKRQLYELKGNLEIIRLSKSNAAKKGWETRRKN